MNTENVESYIRTHHNRRLLTNYRIVKKFYYRVQTVPLDIHFLKTCQQKDVMPKFLWFKTANRNLGSSSAYKECQRRLLKSEIDEKYRHLHKIRKLHHSSVQVLEQGCLPEVFQNLQQIIIDLCRPMIAAKQETIERKLNYFSRRSTTRKPIVDRTVVSNISSRLLSNDEVDCLSHGLDYNLVPQRFDDMNAVGNIEQFFHRVTNIFQHHKDLLKDVQDKSKIISNDIRVLSAKEMTLASNLRSLSDSFRYQAIQYRKKQSLMRVEQTQYHHLLKELKKDKSIIVTRPDKGRGVVIMDKTDYVSKMNAILSDRTKFSPRFDDPTLKRERNLTTLLRKLKKDGLISDAFYNTARPTGSAPGRLYGLPKMHKKQQNYPLRPVLSSIRTFNYGLAKALKQMLSSIIKKDTIIKDSFAFVDELKTLKHLSPTSKMVSFDVVSLYTNIPLTETINIILNHLYNDENPPPSIPKDDMVKVLEFATKLSHFSFNGQLYDQIDGVCMESPLAPLFAEIFLQDFETKHLPSIRSMGIIHWKRYVDDTFVLVDPKLNIEDILPTICGFHPCVQFTHEEEHLPEVKNASEPQDSIQPGHVAEPTIESEATNVSEQSVQKSNVLSFLDVLVERRPDPEIGFQTKIYRKSTFTGLTHSTRWVPPGGPTLHFIF